MTPLRVFVTAVVIGCPGGRTAGAVAQDPAGSRAAPDPIPVRHPEVRTYAASRAEHPLTIDGALDEPAWRLTSPSDPFVDIEGPRRPDPPLETRVRLLWDDSCLYVGAMLAETHLWGTITTRDAVVFQDNDFEVFLDPDGDTHDYVEIEINTLGTIWDLRLPRPYRDGGGARTDWDLDGLRSAVRLDGTLNDPSDRDRGWTVEMAIPWASLGGPPPRADAEWRVNFSRVQWTLDSMPGGYRKRVDPATGRPLAEANWVWSPQYAVNMHMPELWGRLRFVEAGVLPSPPSPPDDAARWALRRLYYAQREYGARHGRYALRLDELAVPELPAEVALTATGGTWEAALPSAGSARWHIRADGCIWRE